MKIAVIIVRTLVGLMFLFASVAYFFKLFPEQAPPAGHAKIFMEGITASGYLMPLIKATELVCALALLAGRYVALALIVLFPVIPLLLGVLFLAYASRQKYMALFESK